MYLDRWSSVISHIISVGKTPPSIKNQFSCFFTLSTPYCIRFVKNILTHCNEAVSQTSISISYRFLGRMMGWTWRYRVFGFFLLGNIWPYCGVGKWNIYSVITQQSNRFTNKQKPKNIMSSGSSTSISVRSLCFFTLLMQHCNRLLKLLLKHDLYLLSISLWIDTVFWPISLWIVKEAFQHRMSMERDTKHCKHP